MPCEQRDGEDVEVGGRLAPDDRQTGERDRQDEQVDQNQIEREEPGRRAQFALAAVFDDCDVELARQQYDGEAAQHREDQPGRGRGLVVGRLNHLAVRRRRRDEPVQATQEQEGGRETNRQERGELDDRFDRHRQHQPVLMLRGVGVACAEQDGEHGEQEGNSERYVADKEVEGRGSAVVVLDHQAD